VPIDTSQGDQVRETLEELTANPRRFQRTGGYERLLQLLQDGHSPDAVKNLLNGDVPFVGDLLWTICELDDVSPYVAEATRHIAAHDHGTAAYAVEVVLRGGDNMPELQAVFRSLELAPLAVCEHAVRVLAGQGTLRVRDIFRLISWDWAASLFDDLADSSHSAQRILQSLIGDARRDRQIVGLVIATIASEHDDRAVRILEQSSSDWAHEFAVELRRIFGHRWDGGGNSEGV